MAKTPRRRSWERARQIVLLLGLVVDEVAKLIEAFHVR